MNAIASTVSFDPTFANKGVLRFNIPNATHATATAVAIAPSGAIYVAGGVYDQDFDKFWITRLNAEGTIDQRFGENGFVIDIFGPNEVSYPNSLSILSNGDIVLIGTTGLKHTALARYLEYGSPNLSFGNNGKVILDTRPDQPDTPRRFATVQSRADRNAPHCVEMADGKIVITSLYIFSFPSHSASMIYRLNPNGSPDPTFAGTGHVAVQHPDYEQQTTNIGLVVPQKDGKLLAAGIVTGGPNPRCTMFVRYLSDGSRDISFGNDGYKLVPAPNYLFYRRLQRSDDGVVAVGTTLQAPFTGYLEAWRSDGSHDPEFNDGKPLLTSLNDQMTLFTDGFIDDDEKLMIAGVVLDSNERPDIVLARFNPDGTLDKTLDNKGWALLPIGGDFNMPNALIPQADGKLLVAGEEGWGAFISRLMVG
ncbi:hypothetical protein ACTJK3_07295 [Pseudomonas sp. 22105]|jgi:uncharacterized delta-60 repeat protein|uniref:hypothetical protein n=1 Tax=unclassified Pseudomonas TaxID=196821 RepID=UPI000D255E04|nr:hypothetical protein DBV33_21900 [Pseudomonas fluorescens]